MKHSIVLNMACAGLAGAVLLASSCRERDHHHPIPVYQEWEVNDTELLANYIGTVGPGSRLFVEGDIRDDGFDPFDGFAFIVDRPVHVEFALWADDPYADLDICVWDPQIGAEVACYMTGDHPEVGAIDVLAGGIEFHLVVESYVGISSYSLEVTVYSLVGDSAAPEGGATIRPSAPTELAQVDGESHDLARATACVGTDPLAGYRLEPVEEQSPRLLESLRLIEVNLETGETTMTRLGLLDDGTWMGVREERAE